MKLASLKAGRDGRLVVVSKDLSSATDVPDIAKTMQYAIDHWDKTAEKLQAVYERLNGGNESKVFAFEESQCCAPLPRAYQWLDGSAYLYHVELVRKARGAKMPPEFLTDPLMYQGVSSDLLGPKDNVYLTSEEWGIDFEAEVVVITDDVAPGISSDSAKNHIKLLTLVNDVSLRNLIPKELSKGFGFIQSKPPSAYTAIAVTPDELGDAWQDSKIHLPLHVHLNDREYGHPDCGTDMNFNFSQLIAHAAKSRPLTAGTLLGSGTISNRNECSGSCCLAEKRMIEIIETGKAKTPFMSFGDRVRIEMFDKKGGSIFGAIDHVMCQKPSQKEIF